MIANARLLVSKQIEYHSRQGSYTDRDHQFIALIIRAMYCSIQTIDFGADPDVRSR